MVHDAPDSIGPLQLLVWLNGAVAATFETCSGHLPLLSTVTVRALSLSPRPASRRMAGRRRMIEACGISAGPVDGLSIAKNPKL